MNIKKSLQRLRLKIGKFILDSKSNLGSSSVAIQTILFLRHDGKIGDYIVSSFVFRELKRLNPSLKIGVICAEKMCDIFQKNPYIDAVYPVKTKHIRDYLRVAQLVRQADYDVLIDPTVMHRNRDLLLVKQCQAKINIGYRKSAYRLFDFSIEDKRLHFSQIYQKAVALAGYDIQDRHYDIPQDEASEAEIQSFLNQQQIHAFIAVNFFGASSSRSFNRENQRRLLAKLREQTQKTLVLLSFPAVKDQLLPLTQEIENCVLFEETKTIFHNIALIRQSDGVISPDTSIVHLASGLNKPLIAFYSDNEENFEHWHPNNTAPTVIFRYQKNINALPMSDISVDW